MMKEVEIDEIEPIVDTEEKELSQLIEYYLLTTNLSSKVMIEQLEAQDYDRDKIIEVMISLDIDWTDQALKAATMYLEGSIYCKQSMIDQLLQLGFDENEAGFGAEFCGANWEEEAVKYAKRLLDKEKYSRSVLVSKLKDYGFTEDEANYGASKALKGD